VWAKLPKRWPLTVALTHGRRKPTKRGLALEWHAWYPTDSCADIRLRKFEQLTLGYVIRCESSAQLRQNIPSNNSNQGKASRGRNLTLEILSVGNAFNSGHDWFTLTVSITLVNRWR
jgi:hypothetical protein